MFEFYRIDTLINDSNSFWLNLLVTVLGTTLGFLGAFYLTKLTDKKQQKKETQQKFDLYKDRLTYMTQLIETCIDIIKRQIEKFEKFATEIDKTPTEQHLLELLASNDLQRLQTMDTEEAFHAYHLIIPESHDKISDYKDIYSSIDFLYLRLKQAIDSADKHVNFIHRDQLYIKEKIENLSIEVIKWLKQIEVDRPNDFAEISEYKFLILYHNKYQVLIKSRALISAIETDFLIPFRDELRIHYNQTPFFHELNLLMTQTSIKFDHIRINSQAFSSDIAGLRKELSKSLEKLEKINTKIMLHNTRS